MENATPATEAAPATDNAAPEATPVSTETAKPTEAKAESKESPKESKAAVNTDEKAYRLSELIRITEKEPNKTLSDEDQAIYEEWVDNKIQPKERPEKAKEEKAEPEKSDKPVEKAEKAEVTPAIEAAMKEVGAKTPDELQAKIKELRQAVSGKETKAIQEAKLAAEAKLRDAATNEAALWRDFVDGKPEAVAFVERHYGLKAKQPTQTAKVDNDFDPEILADADALTGGITSKLLAQLKAAEERINSFEGTFKTHQKEVQSQQARQAVTAQMVDEMIAVSQHLEEIKDIPNLRNVIIDRVANGKDDPRLEAFNEILKIAMEEAPGDAPLPIHTAYLIKKGRDAELLIARAREEGLQSAYNHKPNKSLSSIQTEDAEPQTITDSQIALMEKDFRAIPENWFDKAGNLVKAKVPKKAWAALGIE